MTPPLSVRSAPGLSATLPFPRSPELCQSCGVQANALTPDLLTTWTECDAWDREQSPPVYVVLCQLCAKRLIDPHPRLYRALDRHAPAPGAMALCVGCAYRSALDCGSSLSKQHGGPGMAITYAVAPFRAHVCRSPRSLSGFTTIYPGPPRSCAGFEATP